MIEFKHVISFDVFGYTLNIIYTDDIEQSRVRLNDKVDRLKSSLGNNIAALHSSHSEDSESYIFFTPKSSIGTIAHEVSHGLWNMFNYYGCELENETFAYHLSYTLDKCIDFKNLINKKKLFK